MCKKFRILLGRPKVTLPKTMDFNDIVSLDYKHFGEENVLWIVDTFTKFIQRKVLAKKNAPMVIEVLNEAWILRLGLLS